MALSVLALVGVSDLGTPPAEAAPSDSRFAGTYLSDGWSAPISISGRGQIASSYSSAHVKGSMSGSVSADGTYAFTVSQAYFETGPRDHGWQRWSNEYAGTMALDGDGNIVASGGSGGSFVWTRE